MIDAIKSEFRKLLTVRSTYVIIAACLAITVFFAFYLEGYHITKDVTDPGKLASEAKSAATALGLFIALAGVLLFTHEYRYNTIMYTLTASKSRTKVLLAKIVVVSVFSIALTLLVCTLAPLLTYLGIHAKGLSMVPQTLDIANLAWRVVFFGWAYSMLALLIAAIVRNQVGTIAVLFLFPSLAESLLGLLLKENAKYLPFTALSGIVQETGNQAASGRLSPANAASIVLAYLIAGWIVAWLLFTKRDAN